jgi:hypothetical protein
MTDLEITNKYASISQSFLRNVDFASMGWTS